MVVLPVGVFAVARVVRASGAVRNAGSVPAAELPVRRDLRVVLRPAKRVTVPRAMHGPLVAALDAVATAVVHRALCDRAAVTDDAGTVHALVTPPAPATVVAPTVALASPLVARLCVERVDDARWLHADLGSLSLLARLAPGTQAAIALAFVSAQLRVLGVSVEHAPGAHE